MIPKYRAWISEADTMTNDLKGIDFENETVVLKKFYWEDGFPAEEEVFEVEIGNAIILQSTGLKDKNGKEIFEGDVVRMRNPRDRRQIGMFQVVRVANSPMLGLLCKKLTTEIFNLYEHMRNYYEVKGNIYENPEFLEDKK